MITKTSLSSQVVQERLNAAMRTAVMLPGREIAVFNRKGSPYIGMFYLTGRLAHSALSRSSGFLFFEYYSARDCTRAVLEALRGPHER